MYGLVLKDFLIHCTFFIVFLSSSRSRLMSSKLHQLVLVHSVVAPSGELRGKGRCGVFARKTV